MLVCALVVTTANLWELVYTFTEFGTDGAAIGPTYTGKHFTYTLGTGGCTGGGYFQDEDYHQSAISQIWFNGTQESCASAILDPRFHSYGFHSHASVVPAGGKITVVGYDKTSSYFSQYLCGQQQYE